MKCRRQSQFARKAGRAQWRPGWGTGSDRSYHRKRHLRGPDQWEGWWFGKPSGKKLKTRQEKGTRGILSRIVPPKRLKFLPVYSTRPARICGVPGCTSHTTIDLGMPLSGNDFSKTITVPQLVCDNFPLIPERNSTCKYRDETDFEPLAGWKSELS